MSRKLPTVATAVTFDEVVRSSPVLTRLIDRLRESEAMLASVRPLLPAALCGAVRAGPLDETGWSILSANAAVGAKLRQLMPALEAALRERGHLVTSIRIKVVQTS